MADFTKDTAADIAANNPGLNMGTSGSMHETDQTNVGDEEVREGNDEARREHARRIARPFVRDEDRDDN